VVSQKTLAGLVKCSTDTIKRALSELRAGNWNEIRRGQRQRDRLRYSLFSAVVLTADAEQPDRVELENQPPLRKMPAFY
jgi:DNA-binding transcriptional MocR family regulator